MEYNRIILIGELLSIIAVVFISIKLLILEPKCFSLFDGYTSVLPIVFTKIVELMQLYKRD